MRWSALTLWMMVLGACSTGPEPQLSAEGPLVVGPVESIAHRATASGMLVRAAAGSREMCGIQATVDADTRYLRRQPGGGFRDASLAEITVGLTVEVYVDGPVMQSCPVQGRASAIVILS